MDNPLNIFKFFNDLIDPEPRRIAYYDSSNLMVSTASVSDGAKLFETAIAHPEYNNGDIMIVEAYDTMPEAMDGHARWLALMLNGPLPDEIADANNSEIQQLLTRLTGPTVYKRCCYID